MEQNTQESSLFDLRFDETAKDHLRKIASWAIIVAVCSFISYLISIAKALSPAKNQILEQYQQLGIAVQNKSNIAGLVIQIVIGLAINIILIRFAMFTRKGVNGVNQIDLNRGFSNFKAYFTFIGVLLIIFIALMFLGILAGGLSGGSQY